MTDANGNKVTSGIGALNPFRYRGYFYDTETGLYYLNSRYYDPEIGRFISADSIEYADPETINGINLYAYCGNNPVMNIDPSGEIGLSFILMAMLIGGLIGGAISAVKAVNDGLDAKGIALSVLGGFVMGAAVSGAFALGGVAVSGLTISGVAIKMLGVAVFAIASYGTAVAGTIDYLATSAAYDNQWKLEDALISGVKGFFEGAISFGFGVIAGQHNMFKYTDKSLLKDTGYLFKKPIESFIRFLKYGLLSLFTRSIFERINR